MPRKNHSGLFQTGVSGNPSGRPKDSIGPLVREKTNNGEEMVDRALKIMRKSRIEKNIMTAIEWLTDRGWGKAVQEVVHMKFVYEFISIVSSKLNQILPESCPHCKKALTLRESTIKELEGLSKQMEAIKP